MDLATVDATSQKVQRMLASSFSDVRLTERGFAVPYGSSEVLVEIRDWGTDSKGEPQSLVYLWAPLGREVTPTPELYQWAAVDGQANYFGSVRVIPNEDGKTCLVTYEHTLLGDYIDPMELETAVAMMYVTADKLDEIVHDTFGGKRFTDE
jgi:hypothetical protein